MVFWTACFIAMVFVDGLLRWVLFACAVQILPYIAVVAANQAKLRSSPQGRTVEAYPAIAAHDRGTGRSDPRSLGDEQAATGRRVAEAGGGADLLSRRAAGWPRRRSGVEQREDPHRRPVHGSLVPSTAIR